MGAIQRGSVTTAKASSGYLVIPSGVYPASLKSYEYGFDTKGLDTRRDPCDTCKAVFSVDAGAYGVSEISDTFYWDDRWINRNATLFKAMGYPADADGGYPVDEFPTAVGRQVWVRVETKPKSGDPEKLTCNIKTFLAADQVGEVGPSSAAPQAAASPAASPYPDVPGYGASPASPSTPF